MKPLFCFAGAAVMAATLAASAPALAGPMVITSPTDPDRLQTTIKLGDLDLGRPAGAQAAVNRIRRAARAVCGEHLRSSYPLSLSGRWRACTKVSMRDAVTRLDRPLVTRAAFGEDGPTVYAVR